MVQQGHHDLELPNDGDQYLWVGREILGITPIFTTEDRMDNAHPNVGLTLDWLVFNLVPIRYYADNTIGV